MQSTRQIAAVRCNIDHDFVSRRDRIVIAFSICSCYDGAMGPMGLEQTVEETVMDKMEQWREGLISDSEVMTNLLSDLIEVKCMIQARETKIADGRLAELGIKPFEEPMTEIIKQVEF